MAMLNNQRVYVLFHNKGKPHSTKLRLPSSKPAWRCKLLDWHPHTWRICHVGLAGPRTAWTGSPCTSFAHVQDFNPIQLQVNQRGNHHSTVHKSVHAKTTKHGILKNGNISGRMLAVLSLTHWKCKFPRLSFGVEKWDWTLHKLNTARHSSLLCATDCKPGEWMSHGAIQLQKTSIFTNPGGDSQLDRWQ